MKKKLNLILIICVLAGALVFINRDLFRYENIYVYHRSFSSGSDLKGDYILSTEPFTLKPGTYRLNFEGSFSGTGSGFFLLDSNDEKAAAADFPVDSASVQDEFTVNGSAGQYRMGISWDPDTGSRLTVDRFLIRSDHVLYRSSLMKHAVISCAVLLAGAVLLLRFSSMEVYRKVFPHLSRPENERMMLMIIFLTILTVVPFFRSDTYVNGDDFYYHMRHLKGIAASLRAGHFPARILLDWVENYGYGSGFYYPNLFLTLPALLILCGFHEIAAYEIFTGVCTFFSLLTMFLAVRRISGSEKAACAGIMLYAFAAYRLTDIYYRAALGEIQTFIFLPMIIWGLYEIFHGHADRWWIFGLAFTGLLCCHVISLALAGVFTALWLLFSVRRVFTDKKVIPALLKAVLLTLALGAWFILPMAEQSVTNTLKINSIMFAPDTEPFGSVSKPGSLLLFFYDWNYVDPVRKAYPGWTFLIIPLLRILFLRRKDSAHLKLADRITVFGFIAMIMCTSLFPWNIFIRFLYRIQFSWRIMMVSTVLLSVSCAVYAEALTEKLLPGRSSALQLLPVFLLCFVCGAPILIEALTSHVYPMDNYRYIERSNFLSGGEYMPVGLDRNTIEKTGDHVVSDVPGFEMLSFTRKGLSVRWDYTMPDGVSGGIMQVPLIYYTGYRGYMTDSGKGTFEIPVSKNDVGLITVANMGISSGSVNVRYVKTPAQHIGDGISLGTLVLCLFLLSRKKKI